MKSKTDDNIVVPVNSQKLNQIINLWTKINPTNYLLIGEKYTKITRNSLIRHINHTFQDTGKQISVGILRKIYLSHHYGDSHKNRVMDSIHMNHSMSIANTVYLKTD